MDKEIKKIELNKQALEDLSIILDTALKAGGLQILEKVSNIINIINK